MAKPWTQPKRNSITGASSGVGGSSAVLGMSKLPKVKVNGPPSNQKSRSSSADRQAGVRRATATSMDHQAGARRAMSAVRSPSKTRTPLRASRLLVSLPIVA
jgi:hypothetical protein